MVLHSKAEIFPKYSLHSLFLCSKPQLPYRPFIPKLQVQGAGTAPPTPPTARCDITSHASPLAPLCPSQGPSSCLLTGSLHTWPQVGLTSSPSTSGEMLASAELPAQVSASAQPCQPSPPWSPTAEPSITVSPLSLTPENIQQTPLLPSSSLLRFSHCSQLRAVSLLTLALFALGAGELFVPKSYFSSAGL